MIAGRAAAHAMRRRPRPGRHLPLCRSATPTAWAPGMEIRLIRRSAPGSWYLSRRLVRRGFVAGRRRLVRRRLVTATLALTSRTFVAATLALAHRAFVTARVHLTHAGLGRTAGGLLALARLLVPGGTTSLACRPVRRSGDPEPVWRRCVGPLLVHLRTEHAHTVRSGFSLCVLGRRASFLDLDGSDRAARGALDHGSVDAARDATSLARFLFARRRQFA